MIENTWPELDVEETPFGDFASHGPSAPLTHPTDDRSHSSPVGHLYPQATGEQVLTQMPESASARVETALATTLAQAFFDALQVLQQQHELEAHALRTALDKHCETLQATVSEVKGIASRFQELEHAVSLQKTAQVAAQQDLCGITASLDAQRICDTRHEAALRSLREETESLSAALAAQVESVTGRGAVREELGALKAAASEVTRRLDEVVEGMDHHAEAIHSLQSQQNLGEAALDRFVQIWTQLKASTNGTPRSFSDSAAA
jgi:hypothetical protein